MVDIPIVASGQPTRQSHLIVPLTPLISAHTLYLLLAQRLETTDTEESRALQVPCKNLHLSAVAAGLRIVHALRVSYHRCAMATSLVGYIIWAVFHAGDFNMSTWVPPVWALTITGSIVLMTFPPVIDRN